jgi:hypothetical protein
LAPGGEHAVETALDPVTGLTDQNGAFTLLAVPAGQYVLRVMTPRITGGMAPPSTPEKPILWASEPVTVGDTDVSGIAVTLRHTFRVAGRIEFQGSKPGPAGQELRECCHVSVDHAAGMWGGASTTPDANGNFATGVAGGSYFLTAEDATGWQLKAVMFQGRDISDVPLEIKGDVSGIVILYSDDVSRIAGTVRNARGAPEANASVVVFPAADRQQWSGYGSRFPRRVRSATVSLTGTYAVTALPPGDYFVAAIPDTLIDSWLDPKILETISRTATRVPLAENEKRSLDLKVSAGR